jgi:hypothetical protein
MKERGERGNKKGGLVEKGKGAGGFLAKRPSSSSLP